jgi:hypothetical protein
MHVFVWTIIIVLVVKIKIVEIVETVYLEIVGALGYFDARSSKWSKTCTS